MKTVELSEDMVKMLKEMMIENVRSRLACALKAEYASSKEAHIKAASLCAETLKALDDAI